MASQPNNAKGNRETTTKSYNVKKECAKSTRKMLAESYANPTAQEHS
jgi:hypothetical protein